MSAVAVDVIELVLKPCSRVYGVAPCVASIPATGSKKCFNSPATCQDPVHYDKSEQVLRWVSEGAPIDLDFYAIPSLVSVSTRPQKINPGKDLGVRESGSVRFKDHPHNDYLLDKYPESRDYNPYLTGTFAGKLFARWEMFRGFEIRHLTGMSNQPLSMFDVRHYIVESTSGPDLQGSYSFNYKDVLKLLDGDKSQGPDVSPGVLATDLTDQDGISFSLLPPGIGNLSYPASGPATIGDEWVLYSRSSDAITLTSRGVHNTKKSTHKAGDTFQIPIEYINKDPSFIINDLLLKYTKVPLAYYDYAIWLANTSGDLGLTYTGRVAKPTAISALINELIEQCGLVFYSDVRAKKINIEVLTSKPSTLSITDEIILDGSLSLDITYDNLVNSVMVFYGLKNPMDSDQDVNYGGILNRFDISLSSAVSEASLSIYKVSSRWITSGNATAANHIIDTMIPRLSRPKRVISFSVPKSIKPFLNQVLSVSSMYLRDDEGKRLPYVEFLVTQIDDKLDRFSVNAEEAFKSTNVDLVNRKVYIGNDVFNVDLKSYHDSQYAPATAGTNVRFIVQSSVIGGSESSILTAVYNGGWPVGVSVSIEFRGGRFQGAGGDGSYHRFLPNNTGEVYIPAKDGGIAFHTDQPITLIDAVIWGGGGGAEGGTESFFLNDPVVGGAGAGYRPGGSDKTISSSTAKGLGYYYSKDEILAGYTGQDGGDPGFSGDSFTNPFTGSVISGGDAGFAVVGFSLCTFIGTTDIRGPVGG